MVIIFEDVGAEQFQVKIEGERANMATPPEEWTEAQRWAEVAYTNVCTFFEVMALRGDKAPGTDPDPTKH